MAKDSILFYDKPGPIPCFQNCGEPIAYMNVDEKKRDRGDLHLYCPVCGTKYFGEVHETRKWATDLKSGKAVAPTAPNPYHKPEEEPIDAESTGVVEQVQDDANQLATSSDGTASDSTTGDPEATRT